MMHSNETFEKKKEKFLVVSHLQSQGLRFKDTARKMDDDSFQFCGQLPLKDLVFCFFGATIKSKEC